MAKEPRTITKRVVNAVLFSDGTIRVDNLRFSYPYVGKPRKNVDDNGVESEAYQNTGLANKKTHREAKDLIVSEMNRLLKEHKIEKLAANKKFIKDGDQMDRPENEGMWVISAREQNPPGLRGNKKDPETGKPVRLTPAQAMKMFYGGCWGSMVIRPWFQSNKYGKRLNAGLVAVQFLKDDEPFGEGRISDDDVDDSFEATETDDAGGREDDDDSL